LSRKVLGCRFYLCPSQTILIDVILLIVSGAGADWEFVWGDNEPVLVECHDVRTTVRSFWRVPE